MNPADSPLRANPVFWLIWILLGAAVLGGLATLVVALQSADRQLPESYHWEGEHLDRDFARARLAAEHGIEVDFTVDAGSAHCAATLRNAPEEPEALNLLFTNAADPGLDRVLRLARLGSGSYGGACSALPEGRWRVSLEDAAGVWRIRAQVAGSVERLELRARRPDGDPAGGS